MNPTEFAATLTAATGELQTFAEAMMTLTLAAYRPTGLAKVGGYDVQQYAAETPVKGKVQGPSASTSDTDTRYLDVGGDSRPVLAGGLHIPVGAPVPKAGQQVGTGWEYEVTAVGTHDDPALLGRRYLVVGVPAKSKATARRLDVVEL